MEDKLRELGFSVAGFGLYNIDEDGFLSSLPVTLRASPVPLITELAWTLWAPWPLLALRALPIPSVVTLREPSPLVFMALAIGAKPLSCRLTPSAFPVLLVTLPEPLVPLALPLRPYCLIGAP